MLVPNGDRRHCSKSGRVVYKKYVSIRNDDIMRELVLCHDFRNKLRMNLFFRLRRSPREHVLKPGMLIDFGSNRFEFCFR